jgi:hypothetical protein
VDALGLIEQLELDPGDVRAEARLRIIAAGHQQEAQAD